MASISARGCTKVASAKLEEVEPDGYQKKTRLALRSDGKVLQAIDLLSADNAQYGSRGWSRGGYSIVADVGKGYQRAAFVRYATARGFTIDGPRYEGDPA